MGGFISSVAQGVANFAKSKAGTEIGESIERGVYKTFLADKRAFEDIPIAKSLWNVHEQKYLPLVEKYKSEGIANATKAGSQVPAWTIDAAARKQASQKVFGKNREVIKAVLQNVEKTHGKNRADILADKFNIIFHEEPLPNTPGSRNAGLSSFDVDMRRGGKQGGFFNPPSSYRGPSAIERGVTKVRSTLAWKAAIPHAVTTMNLVKNYGFQNYMKVLNDEFGSSRAGAAAKLATSNSISENAYNTYNDYERYKNSTVGKKLGQYLPGSVGEFIHKNMYTPGMSFVRYHTLSMSANAGKHAAMEAAANLQAGTRVKWAQSVLGELGIDVRDLAKRNFQLAPGDINKAYYHGADTNAFLNSRKNTPSLWRQSVFFRSARAFTGYVSNQAAFEKNLIMRQIRSGDYAGLARNLAITSMAYPLVGASIYELEHLLSGRDWEDPVGHLERRAEATPAGFLYDTAMGKKHAVGDARMIANTAAMMAHIGVFGMVTGYVRDAQRHQLYRMAMPPEYNMIMQGGEDFENALKTDSRHPNAWKPLARDMINDTSILGIGQAVSHKILPTRAEEAKKKSKRFHRTKPQEETWNPFNAKEVE